jgi:hypothetical protein
MKTMIRLAALALVVLASLATLPLAAQQTYQPIGPDSCAQFCMIALCAYPQTCGPFVDSTGTPRCGCHDQFGTVE